MSAAPVRPRYSYLGPAGTFTWSALRQVPEAADAEWVSVANTGRAFDDVVSGRSEAAMIAIENSVDGGVSATQDALATIPDLRIRGEYVVPVRFSLVARAGTALTPDARIAAHPVAYAQCRRTLDGLVPDHTHLPAASNVQAVLDVLADDRVDVALAPVGIEQLHEVTVLREGVGDNPNAVTRFVLVDRRGPVPPPTGADKTSVIVELPSDRPGTLLDLLEQFATRGVNMSLIESRPIGDALGRYRFVIDLEGHVSDERVADALLGVKRFSPRVVFLGSYPRADQQRAEVVQRYDDGAFVDARDWLRGLISGEPDAV